VMDKCWRHWVLMQHQCVFRWVGVLGRLRGGVGRRLLCMLLHFLDLNKTQFNSQCMPSKRMRCTRAAKARCVSAVLRPQAVHSALGIPVEQTSEWLLSRCMRRACNDIMMLPEICNCMPHAIVTLRTKTHTGPALTVRLVMEITLALSRARRDRSSSRVPVAIVKTRHLKTPAHLQQQLGLHQHPDQSPGIVRFRDHKFFCCGRPLLQFAPRCF